MDIKKLDATATAKLVKDKQISAEELLDYALDRAKANADLGAITQLHEEQAREQLKHGVSGPFAGVPFLLKDLYVSLKGTPTFNGSKAFAHPKANFDSEMVKRFKKAGFVIFGKTSTPEIGINVSTEPKHFPAAKNPWDVNRSSGGSSGGASAAVASGIVSVAHATDGGGSIRIPASTCGLFGMKPTRARTPMGPPNTEGWAGASIGHVVSKSVRDSAAIMDLIAGYFPGSPYDAPPVPQDGYLNCVKNSDRKYKIAVCLTGNSGVDPDEHVASAFEDAVNLIGKLGHSVVEAKPEIDNAQLRDAQMAIISSNVAALMSITPDHLQQHAEPWTKQSAEVGKMITGAQYALATDAVRVAGLQMASFHKEYDFFLFPTLTREPLKLGVLDTCSDDLQEFGTQLSMYAANNGIYNQTGLPCMSMPLVRSKNNLPVGISAAAAFGREELMFEFAAQLEQAMQWQQPLEQVISNY